jgi:hypothetical protein
MSKRVFLQSEFEKNNSYFLSFLIFALFFVFEIQRKVQNHFFCLKKQSQSEEMLKVRSWKQKTNFFSKEKNMETFFLFW